MSGEENRPRVLFDMPRARKSAYWKFLKLVAPIRQLPEGQAGWKSRDADRFFCLRCQKEFPFVPGSSANVRNHLNNVHHFATAGSSDDSSSESKVVGSKRHADVGFLSPSKRRRELKPAEEAAATKLLVEWVCVGMLPLRIVEDRGLRAFVQFIQSFTDVYIMPARRTLSDRVAAVAEELRARLKASISQDAQSFSLTTDVCTSRTTESYIALTIHFATADFRLHSNTLDVVHFPGKHTGDSISEMLQSVLATWGLDKSQLSKIVRDNGSNVVKACRQLGVEHFGCAAHSLHLVVHGALTKLRVEDQSRTNVVLAVDAGSDSPGGCDSEEAELEAEVLRNLEDEVEKLVISSPISHTMWQAMQVTRGHVAGFHKIVHYLRKSSKGKDRLMFEQSRLGASPPLSMISDVATRWNSTLEMIRRLIQPRQALNKFFTHIGTMAGRTEFSDIKITRPTGEMWFSTQCLEKLLIPFEGMTKALSGEKYPTAALISPCIFLVKKRLSKANIFSKVIGEHDGTPYFTQVVERMHSVRAVFLSLLEKRFDRLPADVVSCSLLHPRFANGEHFNSEQRAAAETFLGDEAVRLAGNEVSEDEMNTSFELDSDGERDFLDELLGNEGRQRNVGTSRGQSAMVIQVRQELAAYFQVVQHDMKEKPLRWWRKNCSRFGLLSRVAEKYLGLVATSVPSERCFSSAGNVVTARRNRLEGATLFGTSCSYTTTCRTRRKERTVRWFEKERDMCRSKLTEVLAGCSAANQDHNRQSNKVYKKKSESQAEHSHMFSQRAVLLILMRKYSSI